MDVQKVFAKMIKANAKGIDVTTITDYWNGKELIKYLLSYPTITICNIEIMEYDWKHYDDVYIIALGTDNKLYCSPAIIEATGTVARGAGLHYIDINAIGKRSPEDFVIENEATIKVVS